MPPGIRSPRLILTCIEPCLRNHGEDVDNIRLSICIPVYNFGAFIGETLESIIRESSLEVEIVVVDGASTDNTDEVVRGCQARFPGLRYYRLNKRGGIDRDMAKSVELAAGEYCWLFGGDDIMKQGAVQLVLSKLSTGADLYLCESILCDFNMRPVGNHNLFNFKTEQTFDLEKQGERLQYFESGMNTAAFFSFCGALIFKKSVWDSVPINESFISSCWAHVARFFEIIPRGLKVTYLPEPCLAKRGDNDSFRDKGIVHRYRIAIEGYNRLADTFFGKNSMEAYHIRRVLRNEFPLHWFFYVKSECHKNNLTDDILILDNLAQTLYFDPLLKNKLYLFIYARTPLFVYRFLSFLLKQTKSVLKHNN